jgi:hypothetical protein
MTRDSFGPCCPPCAGSLRPISRPATLSVACRTPEGWNFEGAKDGKLSGMIHWLLVWTLQLAAELEESFGDAGLADRAYRHRANLAQIADSMFWDGARGLYANDPEHTQYDELVQCFALLSRAVPVDKQQIVEGQLRRGGQARWATVDGLFYLFELCRVRGLTDLFFQRMTLWRDLRRQGSQDPGRVLGEVSGFRPAVFGIEV